MPPSPFAGWTEALSRRAVPLGRSVGTARQHDASCRRSNRSAARCSFSHRAHLRPLRLDDTSALDVSLLIITFTNFCNISKKFRVIEVTARRQRAPEDRRPPARCTVRVVMSSNAKKRRQSFTILHSTSNGPGLLERRREHVAQVHANNADGLFQLKLKTSASFLASTLPTQNLDSPARRQRFLRTPGTAAGRPVNIEGSIMSFGESRPAPARRACALYPLRADFCAVSLQ